MNSQNPIIDTDHDGNDISTNIEPKRIPVGDGFVIVRGGFHDADPCRVQFTHELSVARSLFKELEAQLRVWNRDAVVVTQPDKTGRQGVYTGSIRLTNGKAPRNEVTDAVGLLQKKYPLQPKVPAASFIVAEKQRKVDPKKEYQQAAARSVSGYFDSLAQDSVVPALKLAIEHRNPRDAGVCVQSLSAAIKIITALGHKKNMKTALTGVVTEAVRGVASQDGFADLSKSEKNRLFTQAMEQAVTVYIGSIRDQAIQTIHNGIDTSLSGEQTRLTEMAIVEIIVSCNLSGFNETLKAEVLPAIKRVTERAEQQSARR